MKTQGLDQLTLNCVKDSLSNAKQNGHTFENYTDADVAGDMIAYDDTFAGWTVEALTSYVTETRKGLTA